MKINSLVIPADDSELIGKTEIERGDIKLMQVIVGGTFDVIDIYDVPASLWFNDEGKILSLPVNRRATLLLWLHSPAFIGQDFIVGDVLVTGPSDDEGNTTGIPDSLVDLLFEPHTYRVEFKLGDQPWLTQFPWIQDCWEAYAIGVNLLNRYRSKEPSVRVVTAE